MSEISATEAARNFADLLDAVEHRGETFTIVRRGKPIASLQPTRVRPGGRGQGTPPSTSARSSVVRGSVRRPVRRRARAPTLSKLLFDTTFLIDAERTVDALETAVDDDDDVAIAAITVAELRVGVMLATDRYRAARRSFLENVLQAIPVLDYDQSVAEVHAELLVHVRAGGDGPVGPTTSSSRPRPRHRAGRSSAPTSPPSSTCPGSRSEPTADTGAAHLICIRGRAGVMGE